MGNEVPVFSRATISRVSAIVVTLLSTAVSTGGGAREFRAADTQNLDYPTVQALLYMGRMVAERGGGRPRSGSFIRTSSEKKRKPSSRPAPARSISIAST